MRKYLPMFEVLSMTAAENYRTLLKQWISLRKTLYIIIGTFRIKNNHQLLHHDKDFNQMQKLLSLQIVKLNITLSFFRHSPKIKNAYIDPNIGGSLQKV